MDAVWTLLLAFLLLVTETEGERLRLCERDAMHLSCPGSKVIKITWAKYHVVNGKCGTATCPRHNDVTHPLENLCQNRQNCAKEGPLWMNGIFSDPCYGQHKTLDIEHSCVDKPGTNTGTGTNTGSGTNTGTGTNTGIGTGTGTGTGSGSGTNTATNRTGTGTGTGTGTNSGTGGTGGASNNNNDDNTNVASAGASWPVWLWLLLLVLVLLLVIILVPCCIIYYNKRREKERLKSADRRRLIRVEEKVAGRSADDTRTLESGIEHEDTKAGRKKRDSSHNHSETSGATTNYYMSEPDQPTMTGLQPPGFVSRQPILVEPANSYQGSHYGRDNTVTVYHSGQNGRDHYNDGVRQVPVHHGAYQDSTGRTLIPVQHGNFVESPRRVVPVQQGNGTILAQQQNGQVAYLVPATQPQTNTAGQQVYYTAQPQPEYPQGSPAGSGVTAMMPPGVVSLSPVHYVPYYSNSAQVSPRHQPLEESHHTWKELPFERETVNEPKPTTDEIYGNHNNRIQSPSGRHSPSPEKTSPSYEESPHHKSTKSRGDYMCAKCGESFPFYWELNKHVQKKHEIYKPHECDDCGDRFKTRKGLIKHRKVNHKGSKKSKVSPKGSPKKPLDVPTNTHLPTDHKHPALRISCEVCNRRAQAKEQKESGENGDDLQVLIRGGGKGSKSYTCWYCGKEFSGLQAIQKHMKKVHNYCQICGDDFPSVGELQEHMEDEHGFEKTDRK